MGRELDALLISSVTAAVTSFLLTPVVRAAMLRFNVLDVPNERSSHDHPTPRGGGLAIVAGIAVALLLRRPDSDVLVVCIGALVIAVTGLIDDLRSLSAVLRLTIQILAAVAVVTVGQIRIARIDFPHGWSLELAWLAIPITVIWIVGFTNAYNFMDGINGIAAVEAIIAGLTLSVLFAARKDFGAAVLAAAIAGAASGFLPWNFPFARIFMGDVGSGLLGFLFAALVVRYAAAGGKLIAGLLSLLPFVADAAATMIRRAMRRERLIHAHRTHFYQRLIALGWSHAGVTCLWATLALAGAVVGLQYERFNHAQRAIALGIVLTMYLTIAVAIGSRERRGDVTR